MAEEKQAPDAKPSGSAVAQPDASADSPTSPKSRERKKFDPKPAPVEKEFSLLRLNAVRRLTVQADESNLSKVRDFVNNYGPRMRLSSSQTNKLRMCIDEAFSNIFRHAYSKDVKKKPVIVELINTANHVEIRLIDWGKAFELDTEKLDRPDLQKYVDIEKKGGLGLFMIKKFTDHFELKREKNRNILIMEMNVPPMPESFWSLVRKNLTWQKMTFRVRLSLVSIGIISLVLFSAFWIGVLAQRTSLLKQYKDGAVRNLTRIATTGIPSLLEGQDLDLTMLARTAKVRDTSILYAGFVNADGFIIAHSDTVQIYNRYSEPSSEKAVKRGWFLDFYSKNINPLLEKIPSEPVFLGHIANKLMWFPIARQTNHNVVLSDYRDLGILYLSSPVLFENIRLGTVFMAISKGGIKNQLALFQNRLFMIILIIFLWIVGIYFIYLLAVAVGRPLKDFAVEMRRVTAEGLKARLKLNARGEFEELQNLINEFMSQTESSMTEAREKLSEQEVKIREAEFIVTDATRMKNELMVAQHIQKTLLPEKVPDIEGYEIGAKYEAATELGGDYYDFIRIDEHSLGVAVGDVSGHGLGSALMMSSTKTGLRIEAFGNRNAAQVLASLNKSLLGQFPKGMYITLFYVFLDAKKREINYASAGHNPMILYRGDTGQVYNLNPKGFAVGLDLESPELFRKAIKSESIKLRKGDLLLVYTDGITEAMNDEREEYGEFRLLESIRKHHHLSAQEVADLILDDIKIFTKGIPQSDDITYVVIKEKSSVGEIEYNKRVRLLDLIDNQGVSVTEACKQTGISSGKYQQYRRTVNRFGIEALKEDIEEGIREVDRLDIEGSAKLLHLVSQRPEYSVEELQAGLDTDIYGHFQVESRHILRELKRLNLTKLEKRIRFAKREKMLAEKGRKSVFLRSGILQSLGIKVDTGSPPSGDVEKASMPAPDEGKNDVESPNRDHSVPVPSEPLPEQSTEGNQEKQEPQTVPESPAVEHPSGQEPPSVSQTGVSDSPEMERTDSQPSETSEETARTDGQTDHPESTPGNESLKTAESGGVRIKKAVPKKPGGKSDSAVKNNPKRKKKT